MVTALVLAGGSGTRVGMDIPKQYIKVNGRAIISYCLECLFTHKLINAVQIVADEAWREMILETVKKLSQVMDKSTVNENVFESTTVFGKSMGKFLGFSAPGRNRQYSILNGINDIREYTGDLDYVLIHDAARPFVSHSLITDCIEAVKDHDGVLPVLPMKDTMYFSRDGMRISSLLERSRVFAGQTPEIFVLGKYYEANRRLLPDDIFKINGSTEPAVMAGMDIVMIPGDEGNSKITTAADLERFYESVQKDVCMEGDLGKCQRAAFNRLPVMKQ